MKVFIWRIRVLRVPIKPWESNFLHFQSYQSLSMYFTTYTSTELCNHSPVRQIVFVSVRDKKLNEGKNKRVESAITNCKPCFQPQQNLSGVTYLSTNAVVISKTMFFNDELGSIRELEEGNLSFPPPREWSTFCATQPNTTTTLYTLRLTLTHHCGTATRLAC
jgi:hypothetical protein